MIVYEWIPDVSHAARAREGGFCAIKETGLQCHTRTARAVSDNNRSTQRSRARARFEPRVPSPALNSLPFLPPRVELLRSGGGKKSARIIMDWTRGICLAGLLLFCLGWIGGKCRVLRACVYVRATGFCIAWTWRFGLVR